MDWNPFGGVHRKSAGVTLGYGTGQFTETTWFDDLAGLIDPHDGTIDHFPIRIAFVVLFSAQGSFIGPASECISGANPVAGSITVAARVEIQGTGGFKFRLNEKGDETIVGFCNASNRWSGVKHDFGKAPFTSLDSFEDFLQARESYLANRKPTFGRLLPLVIAKSNLSFTVE